MGCVKSKIIKEQCKSKVRILLNEEDLIVSEKQTELLLDSWEKIKRDVADVGVITFMT